MSVIKLISGSVFGSNYLVQGFIPFVNYFVTSWGQNPYDFFTDLNVQSAFPYPPVMLLILAIPRLVFSFLLSNDWQAVSAGHLFVAHIPIFLADLFIYAVLCRWLETKERYVLWLYWASPILFFVNYIHGQLDVIPMAVLFASLVMLLNKRPWLAALLLGVGIATKTHLIVVLPFYFMYWYVNRYTVQRAIVYSLTAAAVFCVCLLPYLWSAGFVDSVFGTEEATKVYAVQLSYVYNHLSLLLAPSAIVLLFLNFFAYKKLNKDAFLLILTLLFSIFIVLVPPMPGWYYWSIPFIIYFFAKYKSTPQASFWLMNIAYVAYLLAADNAPELLVNSIFTVLVSAIVMNAVWVYRIGVRSNLEYKADQAPIVVGIGGDSGAGKNTLVAVLLDLFGKEHATTIEGDDAHKWERDDAHWQRQTHLDPKSNHLHDELLQTLGLKTGETVQRSLYNHVTGRFSTPNIIEGRRNILYVGLHPFYLSKMRQLFTIKIYLEPDEALRRHWKIARDMIERGRSKADILKQMEQRAADTEKYIRPQRQFADIVVSFAPTQALVDNQPTPPLLLRLTCDNSTHLDPLMVALETAETMAIEHWYDDDLQHQTIQFKGEISADHIRQAAYQLIPNVDELLNANPSWSAGYDGIIQLFLAYYYSETNKSTWSQRWQS